MVFQIKLDLNKLQTLKEKEREYDNQQTETFGSDFIQSVWKGWLVVKSSKIMGIRGLEVKTVKVT